jgi:hypothetical protein
MRADPSALAAAPLAGASFSNLIVTFNNRADIPELLTDLALHAPAAATVVIDNASPDGTADLVEEDFPSVHLVRNPTNVGYARAVNQGIRLTNTAYVFLLNPDIRIDSGASIEGLRLCLAADPQIAVAGPLQFKRGLHRLHLNFTWSYWTPRALKIYLAHLLGRTQEPSGPVPVSFLNAGCLFLRRSAFEAVGGLNERYFLYGEEPDLFFKFMRYGFECRLVPSATVVHGREHSLRTVSVPRRLWFKARGLLNIVDAVIRGLTTRLVDKLTGRVPG